MTVAQAFNLAFSSWKEKQEKTREAVDSDKCDPAPPVCSIKSKNKSSTETSHHDNLLIDLRSPGDALEDKTLGEAVLVRLDSRDVDQDEDMDVTFAK